jgi:hypothetical protein
MSPEPQPQVVSKEALRRLILETEDLVIEPVSIPEWPAANGKVFCRTMTTREREGYLQSLRRTTGHGQKARLEPQLENASANLVVLCACTKDGERIFTKADVDALGKKNPKAMERIVDVAGRINGLTDEALDEAKNVSAETTGSASSSN